MWHIIRIEKHPFKLTNKIRYSDLAYCWFKIKPIKVGSLRAALSQQTLYLLHLVYHKFVQLNLSGSLFFFGNKALLEKWLNIIIQIIQYTIIHFLSNQPVKKLLPDISLTLKVRKSIKGEAKNVSVL